MKISNKRELQNIASSHLPEDFMKFSKDYTKEPHSFLANDVTLLSDNPLRVRKNLL